MGGRIATQIAAADANLPISSCASGTPFTAWQMTSAAMRIYRMPPMLFVQGSRDSFGTPAEIEPVMTTLRLPATIHVVTGGDHSFKVARANEQTQAAVFDDVQRTVVEWIEETIRSTGAEMRQPRH